MRTIDASVISLLAGRVGIKPVTFIDIQWQANGPYVRYSSTEDQVPQAIPALAKIDNIDTGVNISGSSFGVSCGVLLNDPDGTIKSIMDNNNIHKRPCRIMQWFSNLSIDTAFEIFRGQISSPVVWSEGERTLSFTVLDQIYSRDVGFSLEQGQFNYVSDDISGQTWPVCFGDVLHVPAVPASSVPTAIATTMFGDPDPTLVLKKFQMEVDIQNYHRAYWYFVGMIQNLQQMIVPFYVVKQRVTFPTKEQLGKTSAIEAKFTLRFKRVILPELNIAMDVSAMTTAVQQFFPEWRVDTLQSVDGISLIFDPDMSKYQSFDDALRALKPTSFEIFSVAPGFSAKFNTKPTKMWVGGAEIDFQSYETMVYTRASQIQDEYVTAIIAEDTIKQEVEDLSTDAETIGKLYDQVIRDLDKSGDINVDLKVKAIEKLRANIIAALLVKTKSITGISYDKERLEIDAHNLKYVFESIKTIKNKVIGIFDAYIRQTKRYLTLLRIMAKQDELLTGSGQVSTDEQFAQDQELDVKIKGVRIRGRFRNNVFYGQDVIPTDTNLTIAARESEDLDYFWLDDADVDLMDKYCQIQTGFIIKITEQVGRRCRFELVSRKSNSRTAPDDFILQGMTDGMVKDAFQNATDGTETVDELIHLANSIPTDIGFRLKDRLAGGDDSQSIRIFELGKSAPSAPLTGGYYLKYDGKVTDLIKYDASASDIKDQIVSFLGFKSADTTVKARGYNRVLAMSDPRKAKLAIRDVTTGFHDTTDIVEFEIKNISATSENPTRAFEVVEPTDTTLQMASSSGVRIYADCAINSDGGAHEHTVREIVTKIESAVSSSAYSKEIRTIKDKISEATTAILSLADGGSADDIKSYRDIISTQQEKYIQVMSLVHIPETIFAEAYKLISQSEHKVLFGLELLHFLAWRHSFEPVASEIPDPHQEYYVVGSDITFIRAASPIIIDSWLLPYRTGSTMDIMEKMFSLPNSEAFIVEPGTPIYLWGDYQQAYAANLVPSTIHAVHAFKTVDGLRRLSPVPSRYYSKNEADGYGRFTITSLALKKPLSEYKDADWEDQLYVSMTSSVGPNPMDVIAWIINNFTNLTLSGASYTLLHNRLANYPTNFAILEPADALGLVKEIAYQSRCACWVTRDVVSMQYLPEPGASMHTFTESNILFKSLDCCFSDSDFLTTKYVAKWRYDYAREGSYDLVLRYNVNRFNEVKKEVTYFALTHRDLVEKTATFWLIRESNIWKIARFSAPLDSINIEPFDTVTLDFAGNYFTNGPCLGIVQSANFNADSNSMTFEIWLPVRAGERTQYTFAWPANLSASTTYPTPDDIQAGAAGDPFTDTVPTGVNYDPFAVNPTNIRPKDYGDITPTDLTDSLPKSLVDGLEETEEVPDRPENFESAVYADPSAADQPVAVGGEAAGGGTGLADAFVENKANKPFQGPQGWLHDGIVRMVRVVGKNTTKTLRLTIAALVDPTGAAIDPVIKDIETEVTYYNVVDTAGVTFAVEIGHLHPEDTLPANTEIPVIWNQRKGTWTAIVPTYVNTDYIPPPIT